MSAMMSIYQGDGTRNDVPSVFIGVDEDRSDRLTVAFGTPSRCRYLSAGSGMPSRSAS